MSVHVDANIFREKIRTLRNILKPELEKSATGFEFSSDELSN